MSTARLNLLRLTAATALIVGCLAVMQSAASFGFSRILARYAVSNVSLVAANEAVRLTPSDAEAYQARAYVSSLKALQLDAAKDIELAVGLRPRHNMLWMETSNLREANGNSASALSASDNAVRLAPRYGHPRWQRGNLLIRMGRYEEGFNDLREAAKRNQQFVPGLIDLAWGLSRADADSAAQLIKIRDDQTRLAFARFLARRGRGAETLEQLRSVNVTIPYAIRSELISSLIHTKCYREALTVWYNETSESRTVPFIHNASFEEDLKLSVSAFGWQTLRHERVNFALDVKAAVNGARSLRISFSGYEELSAVLSQLLVFEPEQSYRISFAFKTQDLVTGGRPVLQVVDADSGQLLGSSVPLQAHGTDNWSNGFLDFKTRAGSAALFLRLVQNDCNSSACPMFGHVWLDSFAVIGFEKG